MEHAVAKLALSTLSPIISMLGSSVYQSNFGGDVTAEEMRNLKDVVLPKITTVIQEAEYPFSLDHLRSWIDNLQAAAFEAQDLLDLYEYKKIKNQVSPLPKLIKKSLDMTKEYLGFMLPKSSLKVSLEKLQKSAEEAEKLLPLIKSARKTTMKQPEYRSTQASTSTVSTLPSPVFGREKECDIVIQFLLDESHADSNRRIKKIPITAIKGIGGSGKTTTAQGIYNDQRVVTHFDLRMWVHVSRSFDVHRLTKEIIESATRDHCPQISNLDALQIKLKELISKHRRFLLVLDDIWCSDKMQWDQLLSPLNEIGVKGSKIIITTRTVEVTSSLRVENVISLEELTIEYCWSILKHYAFDNFKEIIEDQELADIGNQIISKVKYSPLALRVVGSLLGKRVSVYEWRKILKQDLLKETMDVLLLSFLHLPAHLQRCFAYCSLFPKSYKFYLDRYDRYDDPLIIPLWIAQGFVESTSESELSLEEKGNMYFEELLSYSFFEKGFDGFYDCYVIHDLLHDLAEKIAKKYCYRIEDQGSLDIPATCIHLSMCRIENLVNIDLLDVSKLKKLRSLIILFDAKFTNIFKDKKDIFQNLTKLRSFYVKYDQKMAVLSNPHIGDLKHLRYLCVQYDKKLPGSLAKLYHLQFFYLCTNQINTLQYPAHLKANTLPQGFGNLINLRTLIFYQDSFRQVDHWYYNSGISVEKLTALQNLTAFCPEKDSVNGMLSLKNLLLLRGSLSISNLANVESNAKAADAMLIQKKNLDELSFEWSSTPNRIDNSNICEEVLEGLEPHPNLEKLRIIGYEGVNAPNWMIKKDWLPRLRSLFLTSCKSLKVVPCLPPCLNFLAVRDCNELMQLPPIGNTLEKLYLINCPKLMAPSMSNKSLRLVHICIKRCLRNQNQLFSDLPFLTHLEYVVLNGFSNLQTLPNLSLSVTSLSIKDFPKLTSMGNLQLMTTLKYLTIKTCPMLMTDEPLLVEGGIGKRLPCVTVIVTDEPLLVLGLVQQLAFTYIKWLTLYGLQRPFPPLLEEHFHQLSYLKSLELEGFTTLPNLNKLSSLERLFIANCSDVELLPNLPISLQCITAYGCPILNLNYGTGGSLRNTISHIPHISI